MKRIQHITAFAFAGLFGLGTLSLPLAAQASEEGKRNTAIGLGAAAVALLLTQRIKLPGIVAAGGAAYAYSQYNNDVQGRHRRERDGYYDYPQQSDYRYGHSNSDRYHEEGGYRVHQEDRQRYNEPRYGDNDNRNYRYNNYDKGEYRGAGRRTANRSPR
jgi:hypothetical protein